MTEPTKAMLREGAKHAAQWDDGSGAPHTYRALAALIYTEMERVREETDGGDWYARTAYAFKQTIPHKAT